MLKMRHVCCKLDNASTDFAHVDFKNLGCGPCYDPNWFQKVVRENRFCTLVPYGDLCGANVGGDLLVTIKNAEARRFRAAIHRATDNDSLNRLNIERKTAVFLGQ